MTTSIHVCYNCSRINFIEVPDDSPWPYLYCVTCRKPLLPAYRSAWTHGDAKHYSKHYSPPRHKRSRRQS